MEGGGGAARVVGKFKEDARGGETSRILQVSRVCGGGRGGNRYGIILGEHARGWGNGKLQGSSIACVCGGRTTGGSSGACMQGDGETGNCRGAGLRVCGGGGESAGGSSKACMQGGGETGAGLHVGGGDIEN